jgi:hypothetical protein
MEECTPNLVKENLRMSRCNRLDLQTLGSHLIIPKNLPDQLSICRLERMNASPIPHILIHHSSPVTKPARYHICSSDCKVGSGAVVRTGKSGI